MRYYGVKPVNQGSQVQSPASPVYQMRREAVASSAGQLMITQVNRMSKSRRMLAIGGKQRILRLDMVCIETILFHLD